MMAEFTLQIAGHAFGVVSLFASTKDFCSRYRTELPPETVIVICREALAQEQRLWEEEAVREGLRIRKFSEPFLERAVLQREIAYYLEKYGIFLLHGSTVAVDGTAYLFTAPCGTGKSTHTRLWREVFGARAVMVNDDKPFLALTPAGVFAYGSPWSGKHGLDTNGRFPLGGICLLSRGRENRIVPLSPAEALPVLRRQAEPTAPLEALTAAVPLWHLTCTPTPEAARLAWEAMAAKADIRHP